MSLSRGGMAAMLLLAMGFVVSAGAETPAESAHIVQVSLTPEPAYLRSEHDYLIPDAILTDATGKSISLAQELEAEGPVMVNFVHTRCSEPCAAMTASFAQLQQYLGHEAKQLRLYSISSDPDYDTPARLRVYAKPYRPAPGWMLLTGRAAEIVPVQQAFDNLHGRDDHAAVTFLRAGPHAPWVRVEGLVSGAELAEEYRRTIARH